MKGQVDNELPGRRAVKGLRSSPDFDRAQHGDVDLTWWVRCCRIEDSAGAAPDMPKNGRATPSSRAPVGLWRVRAVEHAGLRLPVFFTGSLRRPGQQDGPDYHGHKARHARHTGCTAGQGFMEQEQPAHYRDHVVHQNRKPRCLEHPASLEGQLKGDEPEGRAAGEERDEQQTVPAHGALGRHVPDTEEETRRAPQRHRGAGAPGHEAGQEPRRAGSRRR